MIATLLALFAQFSSKTTANMERSFIMLKPDAVQRGLVGEVISRLEKKGYKLVAMKFVQASRKLLEDHYAEHKERPFFGSLVEYVMSGPVCAMVWEGKNVIDTARNMIGATNPCASAPGTIRGDYGIDVGRNIIHGSDSQESAKREITLWFQDAEIVDWTSTTNCWIYE